VTGTLTSIEHGREIRARSGASARSRRKPATVVDGSHTETIPAGSTATLSVALNSKARKLLAAHHKLSATLTVTLRGGGASSTASTRTVTLTRHSKSTTS
jgi:hypothetical protein